MIVVNMHETKITGKPDVVRAEFCALCKTMREDIYPGMLKEGSNITAEQMLEEDWELAKCTTKQLEEKVLEMLMKVVMKSFMEEEKENE